MTLCVYEGAFKATNRILGTANKLWQDLSEMLNFRQIFM